MDSTTEFVIARAIASSTYTDEHAKSIHFTVSWKRLPTHFQDLLTAIALAGFREGTRHEANIRDANEAGFPHGGSAQG